MGYLSDNAADPTLTKWRLYYLGLTTPCYWTDCQDHDIEWDGHTWTTQPITPGAVTPQPETATASFMIGDADNVLFPLLAAENGGEMASAAIYEAAFASTNLSAAPDDVLEIFSGRIDYPSSDTSSGNDTITFALMPSAVLTAGTLPTRLISTLVRNST